MKDDASFNELQNVQLYLEHYGMPRRSGRYPWGSGEDPYQHESADFLARYDNLRRQGLSEKEIAEAMGIYSRAKGKETEPSIKRLRAQVSIANYERDIYILQKIHSLQADGLNNTQIAKELGYNNESSIRSLLEKERKGKMNEAMNTANFLEEQLKEKGWIDVGKHAEKSADLGVSRTKMDTALEILQEKGYHVYTVYLPQATNENQNTSIMVLTPEGVKYNDLFETRTDANGKKSRALRFDDIHSLDDYISYDDGATFKKSFEYPSSMDSKRLDIRYAEDGGVAKDGLIEIRRGVADLDLGESNYAQVRILVDGTHYLKGMAVYSDDLPEGKDIIFNTNKSKGTPPLGEDKNNTVLKKIKDDPDNPFGALIKEHGGQSFYKDPNGKYTDENGDPVSLSLINKTREEGDWNDWSDALPNQFLSKQNRALVKKQLDISLKEKELELEEINANTNNTVKKKLLNDFAGECDNAAVHLEAASMPRQKYQVLIPLVDIKDDEVYAPNYENGEKVALIRYPHGGTFEIPILTVNNLNKEGQKVISKAPVDAVGINKTVADRLSGADFDGDTVMVIPTNERNRITSTPQLFSGFDPSVEFKVQPGQKVRKIDTQKQMGVISNLITDMTIKGASNSELERAVKHSMVVIDAEKHNYDWVKSEIVFNIDALKQKYQQKNDGEGGYGGASTIISRAKSPIRVPKRQGSPQIQEDGSIGYKTADDAYYTVNKVNKKTGEVTTINKVRTQESTQMAETKDAKTLVSEYNSPIENLYADYANGLKNLANTARKELKSTPTSKVNQEAKKKYAKEVEHLENELYIAESNKPKERKAQLIANSNIKAKTDAHPGLNKKEIQKISQQEITKARLATGAQRHKIKITDREWDAIQAGALSESKLSRILLYSDPDEWKERTTPKSYTQLSNVKITKMNRLYGTGQYSISEIANILGVSTSTVRKYVKGK